MNRHWTGRHAKSLFFWSATFLVGFQLALNLFMEAKHPEVYDPEYRDRLMLLRQAASRRTPIDRCC